MTSPDQPELLRAFLRERLDDVADLRVVPARQPGRFNVWVVAPGASDLVPALIEEHPDFADLVNVVQSFDSQSEAERLGVPLRQEGGRLDWRASSSVPNLDGAAAEPAFDAPLVVTFYSFRGGVGRSTALAHTAAVLANRGRRVVIVDADLEAPGIHHAFGVSAATERSRYPLLQLLTDFQSGDDESEPDLREYLAPVDGYDDLYILPAGEADQAYVELLSGLQVGSWPLLERNPARELIDRLANSPLEPDVILVDARTGLTDTNAPFLLGASDHVVVVFYPSEQSLSGGEFVTRALLGATGRRQLPVGVHFVASPLPAGKGRPVDAEVLERAKVLASAWVSEPGGEAEDPDFVAVGYSSAIALSDTVTTDRALLEPYFEIADWLDPIETVEVPEPATSQIRSELSFSAGNSDVPDENVLRLFVRTPDADRLQGERILLVEGRKGSGKTTLFRWLLESENAIPIVTPESLRGTHWWPSREVWHEVGTIDPGFRLSWPTLIALRVTETIREEGQMDVGSRADALLNGAIADGLTGFLGAVRSVAKDSSPQLSALQLMLDAVDSLQSPRRVIFDGLDTAFGYTGSERAVRDAAITGLLTLLIDREATLQKALFTAFLRTDIIRGISFTNQSHLFGRRLSLSWEKEAYLKTVLKQAVASSPGFRTLPRVPDAPIEEWTDEQTLEAWYELVGVRVRGKQTAFTDRWVWTRLADGNDDHSPRHIAQLFRVLTERARTRPSESGPPLRARDFGPALSEVVSQEALTAVRDEFPEEVELVLPLFENLGLTPFSPREWSSAGGDTPSLALAQTMGLVAAHPRERDRLIVPELYRYALNVRRRGPA